MPIKKSFPSDVELKRIQTLRKYEKLHDNEQESVLLLHEIIKRQFSKATDIPYLSHAIPSRVSEFYGDFVQGEADQLAISVVNGTDTEQEFIKTTIDENDLNESFGDYAYNQSEYGFEVLLGYVKDNKFKIQIVPKDQYFPQSDGSIIFATYLFDPSDVRSNLKDRKKLLYTQQYRLEGADVIIERKLWTIDSYGRAEDEVSLIAGNITADPEEKIENLGYLPVVQIDNGRKTSWGFGKSDYADILPQLAEVNERRTHVSTQLLKNLDAKLQLPNIEALKDEKGNLKPFDYIMPEKDSAEAKYITNENPLLDPTERHIESQLKMISWTTCVPMFELLKSAMPERVESLRIQLFGAVRKTDKKRAQITKGIRNILYIGYKMINNEEMTGRVQIKYSDVLPTDPAQDTSMEAEQITAGLTSKKSAIMRLHNLSEAEAEAELEQIRNEEIASGALNPNNAPTV